ncbi:MAG: hypothetical protein HC847_22595 [Hydrococcus sp. RU_2_2]|nr:hypothetical protein [Hydrococcus sp. RU_2_2]NJP19672.1 hypothetical protein [Hydrococcus sp. CRU_1_1]NJQ98706.1 hypothetical protein [Hydrococcus sp. CSU_1_8]
MTQPQKTEKPSNTPELCRRNYYRFICPSEKGWAGNSKTPKQLEIAFSIRAIAIDK